VISKKNNPVEWSQLLYELDDAKEHLESLIEEMTKSKDFDEIDFGIALRHIYSHLNRAWNAKDHIGEVSTEDFDNYSNMPTDLKPL
jgi:hypothetical protein